MLIKTKWIENDAVTDAKMKLRSAQSLRSRNAAGSADISLIRLNVSDVIEIPSALSLASNPINNVSDPTLSQDAATKNYVDAKFAGQSPKAPVKAVFLANLTATYSNGALGVGATLTATGNGAIPTADGITVLAGDRVLITAQTTAFQNGIYAVTAAGSVGTPFILTRTTDTDTAAKMSGFYTVAQQGSTVGDHEWLNTSDDPITVGATSINIVDFGTTTFAAGGGIIKTGITISAKLGAGVALDGSQAIAVQVAPSTQKINGSNQVEGLKDNFETFLLAASDITNGYVDLAQVAANLSVRVQPEGGLPQKPTDSAISYTGGTGGKTRVTFAGDLLSLLASGDNLYITYRYL